MSIIKQLLILTALTVPASITFALTAHSTEITPQTQPDCSIVVCTQDGVGQPEQDPLVVLPTQGVED